MARQIELKANTRTETGRGPMKRLRDKDLVPGVVYGGKEQALDGAPSAMNITMSRPELAGVLHDARGGNVLINLQVSVGVPMVRLSSPSAPSEVEAPKR